MSRQVCARQGPLCPPQALLRTSAALNVHLFGGLHSLKTCFVDEGFEVVMDRLDRSGFG